MKITMYELLGLIKDGKEPKHIRYDEKDFKLFKSRGERKMYCCISDNPLCDGAAFDDMYNIMLILNNEVEIIEEDKKIEKIDKVEYNAWDKDDILDKINEIIDVVNEMRDKLE